MSRKKTWEVSDAFWELVQPLIPTDPRVANRTYQRQQGGGRKPNFPIASTFRQWFTSYELASFGMPCPVKIWSDELPSTSRQVPAMEY